MISCVRKIYFCYGHRVKDHESKCANLHGHNAVVWVHATSDSLDALGRVVDFSVLKEKVGGWIHDNWDHNTVVFEKDRDLLEALEKVDSPKKAFILDNNPTAENMAEYLLREVAPKVLEGTGVEVTKIVFWETENCFVEVVRLDRRGY